MENSMMQLLSVDKGAGKRVSGLPPLTAFVD
jgi:hypothetical protein